MTTQSEYKNEILKEINEILPDKLPILYKVIHFFKEEILKEKGDSKDLSRFCGAWDDDRDADEIVAEIIEGRANNTRSEKFKI